MDSQIIFREFQKEDRNAIKGIIREAWHYDEFCSAKVADQLAQAFLSSCLTNQTYTQVAVSDGTPIGIIMGKNTRIHKCPFRYYMWLIKAIISLCLSKEGRKNIKTFAGIYDIDKMLLNESGKKYQGEISFFAISASARGLGIGKQLFHSVLDYMKSQNIADFYLYTDTSCNYGFYEHQGMDRRCEKSKTFSIGSYKQSLRFFIYDYQIRGQAL